VPTGAAAVIKLPNGFEETVTAGKYSYAIKI
jgi:hypothetical protein